MNFFRKLSDARIPAIVIAGNHDSAARIDGHSSLLALAGVTALGKPRVAEAGGVIHLETKQGKLTVGAMPFISERKLLDPDEIWNQTETDRRSSYQETLSTLLEGFAACFSEKSVNIVMAHATLSGATLSHSERTLDSMGVYNLAATCMPATAQYSALGHIHKPQKITGAKIPTFYSGSLIQVDFGEAEEQKGYNLVDVEPEQPAKVEFRPLICQKPLKQVECQLQTLEAELEAHRHHCGYLKVMVHASQRQTDLAQQVRQICPQAIHVELRYPHSQTTVETRQSSEQFNPLAAYQKYYQDKGKPEPSKTLVEKFRQLYEELEHEAS
ncbi:MAG: exonuclease subunit SbcD [Oscillatoriales cyanobacterium SM2_3_0]|nr:exonuclease subunit SbcD [Oscillatoriales cyanobacterium SM2_3_0]